MFSFDIKLILNQNLKVMKEHILFTVAALLISAAVTAQNTQQNQTQARQQQEQQAQTQAQSGTMTQTRARINEGTRTQEQYKNQGQMTRAQKQARNEERKALKKQQKEMKKKQNEAEMNQERYMDQDRTATKNKGVNKAAPQKNTVKAAKGPRGGKK